MRTALRSLTQVDAGLKQAEQEIVLPLRAVTMERSA